MKIKSFLLIQVISKQLRDVKFFIFSDKARNPFAGMTLRLVRQSDLTFIEKVEIRVRSVSRSMSRDKRVRLSDVMLRNLWKK